MCLMGPQMNVLIPPSDKAKLYGTSYLRIALCLLFVTSLMCFFGARYYEGALYLLIILFTGTATRRADGYPLAQVMCSLAMNMAMGLYSLIAVAFYASSTSYSAPSEYWRRVSLLVSIILAPISFSIICYVLIVIYRELRAVLEASAMMYGAGGAGDDMHGHESGMGHIGAPGGHQAGSASSFQHQQMRPSSSYSASQSAASMPASSSSSSFRPFSGTGHTLGE